MKSEFIKVIQLLKDNLSESDFKKVLKVIVGLYEHNTFEYDSGYDPDFYFDIDMIKRKKKNNIINLRLVKN